MSEIYIPGQGVTDLEGRALDRFVNQYDERLSFKRNQVTGDFCIYIECERGSDPPEVPVIGFGPNMPSRDEVEQRLYHADTMRHGEAMLKAMNAHNEKIKDEARYHASQGTKDTTERIEKLMRKHGLSPKIVSTRSRARG